MFLPSAALNHHGQKCELIDLTNGLTTVYILFT